MLNSGLRRDPQNVPWRTVRASWALLALLAACAACSPSGNSSRLSDRPSATVTDTHSPGQHPLAADARYMTLLAEHLRAVLTLCGTGKRQLTDPKLKAYAEQLSTHTQADLALLEAWQQQWFPAVSLSQSVASEHGRADPTVEQGTESYNVRWLQTMIRVHRAGIHLTQDNQSALERDLLLQFGQQLVVRQRSDMEKLRTWSK